MYAEALAQGKVILPHIESTWEYKLSASLDHYVPVAGSGTHTLDNLFCCCLQCNQPKNGSSAYEEIAREVTLGQWRHVTFDPPLSIQEVGSLWRYYFLLMLTITMCRNGNLHILSWRAP